MSQLNLQKLHAIFHAEAIGIPRRYTLTHSDTTGDLFLTISTDYNRKQISNWYIRLMRDEVLAELIKEGSGTSLNVYVHVSGGLAFGLAGWRNDILHHHMPMVLEALRYGDSDFFDSHSELEKTPIRVHFAARQERYNVVEDWGVIEKYRIENNSRR